jgi:ribA/ribD-fused uncharacterized protein
MKNPQIPKLAYSNLLGATLSFEEYSNYIYFYGGIFSQWADCTFYSTHLEQLVNCAEQAMMLAKAKHFDDKYTYELILTSSDPRDQKAYGRQIRGFTDESWDKVKYEIVVRNTYDKFNLTVNRAWGELLLLTSGFKIVEASPTDMVWGIGFGEATAPQSDKNMWGQNLLGRALMDVRDILIRQNTSEKPF